MRTEIKIGFIVNPVAGMGGRVGLKGTDDVVDRARALGAVPIAQHRARAMLGMFKRLQEKTQGDTSIVWLTCAGSMGAKVLSECGFAQQRVLYSNNGVTSCKDTVEATRLLLRDGAKIVVFCGGDGTARDISTETKSSTPILGVPSGVKMYSGVFGTTPEQTAQILFRYISGELDIASVDVLDLDENDYRNDKWTVRLYQQALTPYEPNLSQQAKSVIESKGDDEIKRDIAEFLAEIIAANRETLYLLGPGSTLQTIARRLGVGKTLLGIDAVFSGEIVQQDVNEAQILNLLDSYSAVCLILSPIGAQGFVLGRGNLPLSADVIRRIGSVNLIVVATKAKLDSIKRLRFDTGDLALDHELSNHGYRQVITGSHRYRMVPSL